MPSVRRPTKYYAVRIGREGSRIYDNYKEYVDATRRFSGTSAKGFDSLAEAQTWLHNFPRPAGMHPSWLPERSYPEPSPSSNLVWTEYPGRPIPLHRGAGSTTNDIFDPGNSSRPHTVVNIAVGPTPNPVANNASSAHTVVNIAVGPALNPVVNNASSAPTVVNIAIGPTLNPPVANNISSAMDVTIEAMPKIELTLSPEQRLVLDMVQSGRNIFFTGPAGTGKSVLLRQIISLFRGRAPGLAITAPTGIAGLNIGGSTIHSFAGIGLGKESVHDLVTYMSKRSKARWRETHALIIDEVSMLDGRLFDKLEAIARLVRESPRPFGGIQLILSGDFFQLPPVPEHDSRTVLPATFAFDAESWPRCIGQPVILTQVFRQKNEKFISMLSAMRTAHLEQWHINEFLGLQRPLVCADGIVPTELFPLKREVERCNSDHLDQLPGASHTFIAMDSRGYDAHRQRISPQIADQLLDRLVVSREITLKVGAQVMLLRNIAEGRLVNGSVGKVLEFITAHEARKRCIEVAQPKGSDESLPILPAAAAAAEVEGTKSLIALDEVVFSTKQLFPLVRFTNDVQLLCAPLDFSVQGIPGNVEAQRTQVPLALAWAMSIHKSQGQTLSRVKVNLRRIFEKGQAYVALSRATTMEGLEIVNFDPGRVTAHPRVVAWQVACQKQAEARKVQEEEMDTEEAIDRYHSLSELNDSITQVQ